MYLLLGLSSLCGQNSRTFLKNCYFIVAPFKNDQNILLDRFGVRFVSPFSKKSQTSKTAKKQGKLDKHGHNFVIFSQATGQTWNHTGAYHLSTLGLPSEVENGVGRVHGTLHWQSQA